MKNNTLRFSFVLAAVTAMFLLLFQVSFHFDNKYIYPCQAAKMGVLVLDRDKYDKSPLLFLTDGWEYYADKLHTPQSIQYDTPDRYLYIGQFAGFDMGNPKKNPYGSGTYRMNIFAGGRERTYALEIPQIYTDWKLYVNGKLESVGGDESLKYSHISPDNSMITFKAVDKIEIIVSVSAKSGLYSGLTYPPAFGSAKEVAALVNERLLIHTVEATAAILIGVLFLCIGFGCHYRRPYHVLFCISLCYAVTVSYPFVQVFRLNGTIFSLAERFCSYGIFLAFVLLQADILKLPKKSYTWLAALGCTVLLSVCIEPFIEIKEASIKYWYGYYIAFYKLSSAAWLTATSFIAAKHKKESSKPLLVCACIFAASLIMDRVHPLFEPIRFGWPVETAGFAVICIAAGILWWDTLDLYKEKLVLQVEKNGLLETNKLKSDFLSGISHELQMPLAVISGYAQLTARLIDLGKADDNECLDNQHQIVLESQRMERMIRQLLDISRIESGCFQLDKEMVIPAHMINNIADTYFAVIDKNNNRIQCDISYNLPLVECDKERMEMVLINLMQNACRHTKNGIVTITADFVDQYIQVKVSDTGEGISPEILPHLFEQYLKSQSGKSMAKGTGLGLFLCRKTVEAHGGKMWIESRLGKGTNVYIMLPVSSGLSVE